MEQGALNCETCYGTLTVNGVLLNASWVCAYNILETLAEEADLRGSDRLIPSSVGVAAKRRRRTVTRKDFGLLVTGLYNAAGVYQFPHDRAITLINNVQHLKDNLGFAKSTSDGTVVASWARPDGTTWTADVHPVALRPVVIYPKHVAHATLTLSLPSGRFAD